MDIETRRKRLKFRAWHRGMKECDLLLGRFADAELGAMSEAEVHTFEALLSAPDQDIYNWITGRAQAPAQYDTPLLERIARFSAGAAQAQ